MAERPTAGNGLTAHGGAGALRPDWDWNHILTPRVVFLMLPVVALVVAAYWYPFKRWELVWRHHSAWGHGYLIPLIAVLIAHYRLKERVPQRIEPCQWGLVVVLAGFTIRIWAQMLKYGYPGEVTFLLVVGGTILLALGWEMFKRLWVSVAYLGLMIPWDTKYYESVALPLQTLAAVVAERFLTLCGVYVERQGNVLHLESGPITVAEACSGLHLLFAFVALGVMMAFIYRRPLWERVVIMVSSVPIAVFCNIVRVILMAVSSDQIYYERQEVARGAATWSAYVPQFFWDMVGGGDAMKRLENLRDNVMNPESILHQSFGFAMLALAFALMWAELRVIDLLFVEEEGQGAAAVEPAEGAGADSPDAA